MDSAFGEVFLFLTNLAWKSRMTIPVLVTTVFLIMDIRLQIEINIQSGQVAAADLDPLDDSDDDDVDEYTTDSTDEGDNDGHEVLNDDSVEPLEEVEADEYENNANQIRRNLGLS